MALVSVCLVRVFNEAKIIFIIGVESSAICKTRKLCEIMNYK